MLIGRTEISALLPHAGEMCLLDSVEECGESHIVCLATSHRSAANPLRSHGQLGIMAGIEYASQAMALHAILQSDGSRSGERGYLASLRSISFQNDRLDLIPGALTIAGECQHREATHAVYGFTLTAGDIRLMDGRAVVVIGRPQTG